MARSKTEIRQIVSGAGMLNTIFTELDRKVREYGGDDNDWHRLTTPEGQKTIGRMAEVIMDAHAKTYPFTVNYDRSLAELIVAGRYGYVNDNITEANFPNQGSGKVELNPVLVHLDRYAYTHEVEAEVERRGLRPGTHQELFHYGERHEGGFEVPIIALGSSWVFPDGGRGVVYLHGNNLTGRCAEIGWDFPVDQWHPRDRFLAFSK